MKNLIIGLLVLLSLVAFVFVYQALSIIALSSLHIGQNSSDLIGFGPFMVDLGYFFLAQIIPFLISCAYLIGKHIRITDNNSRA